MARESETVETAARATSFAQAKEVADLLTRLFVIIGGAIYVLGFIIVHSRYRGMLPLTLLQVEYLAAGLLFALLMVPMSIIGAGAAAAGNPDRGRMNLVYALLGSLVVALVYALLLRAPVTRTTNDPSPLYFYIFLSVFTGWMSYGFMRSHLKRRPWIGLWDRIPFIGFYLMFAAYLAVVFGASIHPYLPRMLGGGAGTPAAIVFTEEKFGTELGLKCPDENASYSVTILSEVDGFIWLEDICDNEASPVPTFRRVVRVHVEDVKAIIFPARER